MPSGCRSRRPPARGSARRSSGRAAGRGISVCPGAALLVPGRRSQRLDPHRPHQPPHSLAVDPTAFLVVGFEGRFTTSRRTESRDAVRRCGASPPDRPPRRRACGGRFSERATPTSAHWRRTDRSLPDRSTIALRSGTLVDRASWPRNPVRPSVGPSWRKAWPSRVRASSSPSLEPLAPRANRRATLSRPASSRHESGSDAPRATWPVPGTVTSSRSASSAIFALNAASNFLRDFVIPRSVGTDRAGHFTP